MPKIPPYLRDCKPVFTIHKDGRVTRYSQLLRSPSHAKKRDAVFRRANFTCEYPGCRRPGTELHHVAYHRDDEMGGVGYEFLGDMMCLCHSHHRLMHDPLAANDNQLDFFKKKPEVA